MDYDQTLIVAGWTFAFLCLGLVIVPYLMGRRDLFLPSNLFLGGSALFIGISAVRAGTEPHRTTYTDEDFEKLFVGMFVFYFTVLIVYLYWKLPRRWAGRMMRKWPPITAPSMLVLSIVTTVVSALAIFPIPIPFFRQLAFNVFVHCGPFAMVFALVVLHKDRMNPIAWLNLFVIAVVTTILTMSFGGGRRLLVGAVMTIPIYVYWAWLRYSSRLLVTVILGVGILASIVFLEGYNRIRHTTGRSGTKRAVESAKSVNEVLSDAGVDLLIKMAQPGVEMSLLSIHTFTGPDRVEDGSPFQGIITILVNPVPREFWPDKPEGLSFIIPKLAKEHYHLRGYGDTVTWSMNCVSQGYHDGGLFPIFVYGVIAAFWLRFFDELLIRQPSNPFLIGMLAASSGHIVGFARGSMDVMSWQLIACTFSLLFLWALGRLMLGTRTEYPRTDHLLTYPNVGAISKWMRQSQTMGR